MDTKVLKENGVETDNVDALDTWLDECGVETVDTTVTKGEQPVIVQPTESE